MDVTCSRCQSVYEFEDTLVSTKGVVVRCTHCGHLFKIFPPGTSPSLPEESGWMLRREDGTVFAIDRFSTLQKWIAQGKVTRRDELSRTGESWKRIGEIVELSPFFDMVEASGSTQRSDTSPSIPEPFAPRGPEPAAAPLPGTEPSATSGSFTMDARSAPQAVRAEEPSISSGDTVRQTTFDLAEARRVSAGPLPAQGGGEEEPATTPPSEPEFVARPVSRPPRRPVVPPGDARYSTAEFAGPRKSRAWIWVVVLLVLVGGGVTGFLYRQQLARLVRQVFGGEESATTASERRLETAGTLFALETAESLRKAEDEYGAVLKFNSADDRALGGMLELHATLAQFMRDEIDFGRILGLTGKDPAEAQRLQQEFDREMARARELALALQNSGKPLDALPPEALRALAEAARLQGDRAGARQLIDLAVAENTGDPRTRYAEAMLVYDEGLSGTDLPAAAATVEAAFARVTALDAVGSGLPRARLHLALYLALAGRAAEARDLVRCVVDGGNACPGGRGDAHPDHLIARKVEAWLPLLPAGFSGPVPLALPSTGGVTIVLPSDDAGVPTEDVGAAGGADAGADVPAIDAGDEVDGPDAGLEADARAELEADAEDVPDEAKDDVIDAAKEIAEMPASLDGLLEAARTALENGSTQRAISLLQRAAQLEPSDSEVQTNLGYAYLDAGRSSEARRAFERACQIGGELPDALLGLGDILLSQGSLNAALDSYQRALAASRTPYQRRIAERKVDEVQDRLGVRTPPAGTDAGTRPEAGAGTATTTTPATLPRPPATDVPISDMPAVDSEPPGLPPVTEP
jgi:predicted Zn finger-like uncharacterized protein